MKIHELLKMTETEYELLIMDWWLTFCQAKCLSNAKVFQKLLTNNILFNWWHSQLEDIEEEFIEDALPFEKRYTKVDAKKLYHKHVFRLQKYYNKSLINKALEED